MPKAGTNPTGDSNLMLTAITVLAASGVALAQENQPKCEVDGPLDSVQYVTDGKGYRRCFTAVTPQSDAPMPILFYFHGAGGNAQHCGQRKGLDDEMSLSDYAQKYKFTLVCGEALQDVYGKGGLWAIPEIQTNATGPRCAPDDSVEVTYMRNVVAALATQPAKYDTSRIFTSGCSMGSAFSEYAGMCMYQSWLGRGNITAFATHSTGLKIKGDGNNFPPDNYNKSISWGECDGCEFFPTVPVPAPGLKACLNDNTEDPSSENPFFYRSTQQMAEKWKAAGNRVEVHYNPGGHCQIHSFNDIIQCLDDGTGRLLGK